ncbi:TraK family protein [Brevundimonas sp. R86498]|uniref:TraK family protein n=1 Tax=Brevundimonas sp. R86498 TaxID=3093845 RepID=UPI0037CBC83D
MSRGAGRVAYLAVRPQVEELLASGYDVATIYARLSAGMPVGYKQFAKYVQRFSDDHKVRPHGWEPRRKPVARARPAYVAPQTPPKPPRPPLPSAAEQAITEQIPITWSDGELFS